MHYFTNIFFRCSISLKFSRLELILCTSIRFQQVFFPPLMYKRYDFLSSTWANYLEEFNSTFKKHLTLTLRYSERNIASFKSGSWHVFESNSNKNYSSRKFFAGEICLHSHTSLLLPCSQILCAREWNIKA